MAETANDGRKSFLNQLVTPFTELFGLSRPVAIATVVSLGLLLTFAIYWFVHSAPPKTLIITSGPEGSSFEATAEKYRVYLASNGVTLKVLRSQGSQENLQRLENRKFPVDIGFVQSGITNANGDPDGNAVSLGSVSYQPLLIFYRGSAPVTLLSELKGKRLAIGSAGSGTHSLALELLALNDIKPGGATTLSELEAGAAAKALLDGTVDAAFLMGDSASPQVMKDLLHNPEIQLLSFAQADGYTRRIGYLNKLELPMGSIDFGNNVPTHDVYLIGPTVDLLARPTLHPALVDLLLDAAKQVHGSASLLRRKGEFPAPMEEGHPISVEAARYYKQGKSLVYHLLPFWLASLVYPFMLAFVPLLVVVVPGVRAIPKLYQWRIRLQIYRWYRALLVVEREMRGTLLPGRQTELLARLDEIEAAVNKMKVPASFANTFYNLRGDIRFVREQLSNGRPGRA